MTGDADGQKDESLGNTMPDILFNSNNFDAQLSYSRSNTLQEEAAAPPLHKTPVHLTQLEFKIL